MATSFDHYTLVCKYNKLVKLGLMGFEMLSLQMLMLVYT